VTLPADLSPFNTHDAPGAIRFPLGWLLERASAPVQYRACVDVAQIPAPAGSPLRVLPYSHQPALALALRQAVDGVWNGAMLVGPAWKGEGFDGVGTVPALRRLLEYGWDTDSPPLVRARRPLFRLLAEDTDPAFAYELAPADPADVDGARRARGVLREAGAAALAQAGHEKDPRLRGAAVRILTRLQAFLASPLADGPFVRRHGRDVLAPEAAPPSVHTLFMIAHMPPLRREWAELVSAIGEWLTRPAPRAAPSIAAGRDVVPMPHLLLGDPLGGESGEGADLGLTAAWLELTARLGLLRPGTPWMRAFERLLDDCDLDGVWRPRRAVTVARSTDPFVWPSWVLEPSLAGDARLVDMTFRIGLIARLAGWTVELG
jgi:hypothetical protein